MHQMSAGPSVPPKIMQAYLASMGFLPMPVPAHAAGPAPSNPVAAVPVPAMGMPAIDPSLGLDEWKEGINARLRTLESTTTGTRRRRDVEGDDDGDDDDQRPKKVKLSGPTKWLNHAETKVRTELQVSFRV
jgi:hypothetical protein